MLLAVHYRVMEDLESLESSQEARVALRYRLGQLPGHTLQIANWSASCQLGFLTMLHVTFIWNIWFLCFSGMPVN